MDWIIGLPALGHTAEGGTVREWLKSIGDSVKRSEPIVLVESDKVSLEIEAPGDGVLLEIIIQPGTEVPTGTVLGRIGQPGSQPAASTAAPAGSVAPTVESVSPATPAPTVSALRARTAASAEGPRLQVTPLARRIARDNSLELSAVTGRGKYGQIRKADVLEAIAQRDSGPAHDSAKIAIAAEPSAAPIRVASALPAGLSPMRKAIARRMVDAWRDQPMVTLSRPIDVTMLTEWRKTVPGRPSMTAVLAAAMGRTLVSHPKLNGTIDTDGMVTGGPVHIAVAVALDDGLTAPVIRMAHSRSLAAIDAELAELVHLARSNKLLTDNLSGATVSLSNLGTFGITSFTPILTPPQIAVLGVGSVERVLRETADGGFAFRSMLNVSLTIDHRAVDGADGARFLQALAEALQTPESLLLPVA